MQTNSEKRDALQKWIEQKKLEFSRKFESAGSVSYDAKSRREIIIERDKARQAIREIFDECPIDIVWMAKNKHKRDRWFSVAGVKQNEKDQGLDAPRKELMKNTESKAEQTVPSESSGSVSHRLIEAENILSDLSTGYWVSTLDDADAPVNVKMGQRVLNYWKKQNDSAQPPGA